MTTSFFPWHVGFRGVSVPCSPFCRSVEKNLVSLGFLILVHQKKKKERRLAVLCVVVHPYHDLLLAINDDLTLLSVGTDKNLGGRGVVCTADHYTRKKKCGEQKRRGEKPYVE